MSPELHQFFVETAEGLSPSLQRAFQHIGPVSFPSRNTGELAWFLSRSIVGQQLSTKAARSIWDRIEGAARGIDSEALEVFSKENHALLQQCGVSRNKIKALGSVRKAHEEGRLSMPSLESMTLRERSRHLQLIWGIGPWTADMAAIFFFQEHDVWPEGDSTVQSTFKRYVREESDLDVHQAARLFSPYRSFLALYMWRIADAVP
jgi:DNA-3-methyladenine glycosylase II